MDLSDYNIEPLDTQQLIWLGFYVFFLLTTVISAFLTSRNYLLLASGVAALHGLLDVLAPSYVLSQFTLFGKAPEGDDVQLYTLRIFGLFLCVEAVVLYRLRDRDSDPTIFTSVAWSKVVMYSLLTVNVVYSYLYSSASKSKSTLWTSNEIMFWLAIAVMLGNVLAGIVQLSFCSSWGGYPESTSRLNLHLRIDYFFVLISGILTFALPHWFLSLETTIKPSSLHLYMVRCLGIALIGNALFMGRAPNFLRDSDKVGLLELRVVGNLLIMCLQVYVQNWLTVFTNYHVYLNMSTIALQTLNAAFGYWAVKGYPKFHSE